MNSAYKQKPILSPTTSALSWKELLADPEKHWKPKHSAMSVAEDWEKQCGIPKSITMALQANQDLYPDELLIAIPEYKVPLAGGSRPSQNDVFAVFTNATGLTVTCIEAKYRESFDKPVEEWLSGASEGKMERWSFLKEKIGISHIDPVHLMYQLFHRTASAVIMAEKYHAANAIMIVQSYEEDDSLNHYSDYANFVKIYGIESQKNLPHFLTDVKGIKLHSMWVESFGK